MKYEVKGSINLKGDNRKFAISIDANSEGHARDKTLAYLGSKYGIRRTAINIESITGGA